MAIVRGGTPLLVLGLLLAPAVLGLPPGPSTDSWPGTATDPPHWSWHNWSFGDTVGYALVNVLFTAGAAELLNASYPGTVESPDADLGRVLGPGEGHLSWTVTVPSNSTFNMTVAGTLTNTSGEWSAASWTPVLASGDAVPGGFRYYRWNATLIGLWPTETPSLTAVSLRDFANAAPTAVAPQDFAAPRNTTILLDGSASGDLDNDTLGYQWTQIAGPAVTLANASAPVASFTPAVNGTYGFQLNASDPWATATDLVTVTVQNAAPVAVTTGDQATVRNATVLLDASASTDANGDPLTFLWSLVGPDSPPILNATSPLASFVPTAVGTYTVNVTVTDNQTGSGLASLNVTVADQAPVASAGADGGGFKNDTVFLDGSGTLDPDGDPLSYLWRWVSGPRPVAVSNNTSAVASFLAPTGAGAAGAYAFELNASDPFGASAVATVTVTIANRAPTADAGADFGVPGQGVTVPLDGSASRDADGEPIAATLWTQVSGPPATVNNATSAIADFFAAQTGVYLFLLTVTDPDDVNGTDLLQVSVGNVPPVASLTVIPASAKVNQSVEANASASFDADGAVVDYFFEFGDGTSASGASPVATHAWSLPGLYDVNVTVRDDDGGNATATATVNVVANALPVAIPNAAPPSGSLSTTFVFDGGASFDPDGAIGNWSWDFGDGAAAYTPVATHAYGTRGTFTATLTVTDEDGGRGSAPVPIQVVNRVPVVDAGPDATAVKYAVAALHAAATDDDGDALSFLWTQSAGPAASLTGATTADPSFTPTVAGTYVFQVVARDAYNGSAADSVAVAVSNAAPTASAGSDSTVPKGAAVALDASASSDPDGDPLAFLWVQTAGPPVAMVNADTAVASFVPVQRGAHAFRVEVNDGDGGLANASVTVDVTNAPPSASLTATPSTVYPGQPVTFDAAGSSDADGNLVEFAFAFGDGDQRVGTTAVATHAYASPGSYIAVLVATDDDGDSGLAQAAVTVLPPENNPPNASATVTPSEGNLSTTFFFDATGSLDADGDPITFAWDFGDGSAGAGPLAAHAYGARGSFTASVTVEDGRGGNATATVRVLVVNRAPTLAPLEARRVAVGRELSLAATAVDEDGDAVTYAWRVASGPTTGVLGGPAEATARFLARDPGEYTLLVTVDDGHGGTAFAAVAITAEAPAPYWPWVAGLLFASALLARLLGHEPTRVLLITLFLGALYGRRLREDPDLEVRGMIQGYLKAHPGDTYADIKRLVGLNNGAVSWHLMKLQKEGLIRAHVRDGRRRYYPKEFRLPAAENGGELYEVQRRILHAVEAEPGQPVSVLAENLGLSKQLTLYHLRKLSGKGYVSLERRGLRLSAYQGLGGKDGEGQAE